MAIGRLSNANSEKTSQMTAKLDQMSTALKSDDLAVCNFKIGCQEVLRQLDEFHKKKSRDIEHYFQVLIDSIPKEILNAPINYCLECYADFCLENDGMQLETDDAKSTAAKKTANAAAAADVIDESVSDMKPADKIEPPQKGKKGSKQKQTTTDQEDAANPAKTDEFAVKLLYFLKDFTQVTTKLSDLNKVDTGKIHDNCLGDFKKVLSAINK